MPCVPCGKKWRLGKGPCMYKSKEACEKAWAAYRAKKGGRGGRGGRDGKTEKHS